MKTRKPNGISKKALALLLALAVVMLGLPLTGCGRRADGPLRVLVDLEGNRSYSHANLVYVEKLEVYLSDTVGLEDVELEWLPSRDQESERKAALTRLRTEIMAGKGPDVFLMDFENGSGESLSLFLQPEKSMRLGLFYPLDELMENAEYMETEELLPSILEAGRTEEGQMLLPLSYAFPVTFFDKGVLPDHTPSKEETWAEQMADEATRPAGIDEVGWFQSAAFGRLADYEAEELLVTEEKMLEVCRTFVDAMEDVEFVTGDDLAPPEDHWNEVTQPGFTNVEFCTSRGEGNYTMMPMYSGDGGVMATVTAFAAINANTKRPEKAFQIIDSLFSKRFQQYNEAYTYLAGFSVSPYAGLMQKDQPVNQTAFAGTWGMGESDFAAFSAMRDAVTDVRIYGSLEYDADQLLDKCVEIARGRSEEDLEELVHAAYTQMRQELSE